MKKIFFALLVTLLAAGAHAQLANTKWKTTLKLDNPLDVVFEFGKDTLNVNAVADGSLVETMVYSVKDSVLTIQKTSGQSDCDGSTIGKYKFEMKDSNTILITLVSDDCTDRSQVLDGETWVKG
ncbi:MAG TPA: hypothetical protein VG738_23625 [Chitinophagaceae bacterium]|nr:hypothetical protein [Chitinophagaceae bacterium]